MFLRISKIIFVGPSTDSHRLARELRLYGYTNVRVVMRPLPTYTFLTGSCNSEGRGEPDAIHGGKSGQIFHLAVHSGSLGGCRRRTTLRTERCDQPNQSPDVSHDFGPIRRSVLDRRRTLDQRESKYQLLRCNAGLALSQRLRLHAAVPDSGKPHAASQAPLRDIDVVREHSGAGKHRRSTSRDQVVRLAV